MRAAMEARIGNSARGSTAWVRRAEKSSSLTEAPCSIRAKERTAVIQNHDFVDHGQFEVGVGVVKGHAAVLGQLG